MNEPKAIWQNDETKNKIKAGLSAGTNRMVLALELGLSYQQLSRAIKEIKEEGQPKVEAKPAAKPSKAAWIEHSAYPQAERPAEEIIRLACENYQRKKAHAESKALMNVRVKLDGPIGVTILGDPHLDDAGCNWPQLTQDLDMVSRTHGMALAQIGDVRNNWVGRLAKLYAKQSMTSSEARVAIEWLFKGRPWLFMVQGNHDRWNNEGGNILDYVMRCADVEATLEPHEARVAVQFPNGNMVSIKARHDFAGKSQYNTTHGMVKSALLGRKFDIYVCGHWHISGYMQKAFSHGGWGLQADGPIVSHMVRLGAYKEMDEYSDEQGFENENYAPAVVAILNPYAKLPRDKVVIMPSVEHGCDFLSYLRRKYDSGKL